MEGVLLEKFNKLKPSNIPKTQFNSRISDERHQDGSATARNLRIHLFIIFSKGFIASFLTIRWYHSDGCKNQCHCAPAIYLLLWIDLELCMIIDRAVSAPGNGNYVIDGNNARDKFNPTLAMANVLNTKIVFDDTNFYKFMHIHKNKYDQSITF